MFQCNTRRYNPTTRWSDHTRQFNVVTLTGNLRKHLKIKGDPIAPAAEELQQPIIETLSSSQPSPIRRES